MGMYQEACSKPEAQMSRFIENRQRFNVAAISFHDVLIEISINSNSTEKKINFESSENFYSRTNIKWGTAV